ncbi:MAG: hypothetical protein KTR29_06350 [Rhodothermaceae bacterium]|nr:hypothetical protein [Rhodothermaceae bacterium]
MIFYRAQKAYARGKERLYHPFEPMLLACTEAVDSCLNCNRNRALHAISYLYRMLDFKNAPQKSIEMAKLYDHCEHLVSNDQFQDAIIILEKLRVTWNQLAHFSFTTSPKSV